MWSKRDILMFLAGAQVFHTFSHIVIAFTHTLPINIFGWHYTQQTNLYMTIINFVVAAGLLWWAQKTK